MLTSKTKRKTRHGNARVGPRKWLLSLLAIVIPWFFLCPPFSFFAISEPGVSGVIIFLFYLFCSNYFSSIYLLFSCLGLLWWWLGLWRVFAFLTLDWCITVIFECIHWIGLLRFGCTGLTQSTVPWELHVFVMSAVKHIGQIHNRQRIHSIFRGVSTERIQGKSAIHLISWYAWSIYISSYPNSCFFFLTIYLFHLPSSFTACLIYIRTLEQCKYLIRSFKRTN